MRIDADHPGPQRLGDAQRSADVPRPDRGIEAILAVIRESHSFLFGFERYHDHDGAEHFLARDLHLIGHLGENRGGEIAFSTDR